MRPLSAVLGIALGLCVLLVAPPAPDHAAALASYRIGDSVALPLLCDLDGVPVSPAGRQPGIAAGTLVIEFWSARCPITEGYTDRVGSLATDFAPRDVDVVAVTACGDESLAEIRSRRQQQGTPVPLLVDRAGRLAEQLGVDKTPHYIIIDRAGELVYSGAFDSNLIDTGKGRVDHLRLALEAVLDGRPVTVPTTRTFGSPVRRAAHADRAPRTAGTP